MSAFAASLPLAAALPATRAATPMMSPEEAAKRAQIKETAQKFEASFISIMLGQMFEGMETGGPFGGGQGEAMFRSFFSEAIAKQMTRGGGIGLSDQVSREMLKLQGLS